jgi:long-subunit fatty acid transport protein
MTFVTFFLRKKIASKRHCFLLLYSVIVCLFVSMSVCFGQGGPYTKIQTALQPNPSGSGARALGQGNAFIGIADDATAASWNPGGLTQLEKPEFSFAFDFVRTRTSIDYENYPETHTTNTAQFTKLNYFSVVTPFRIADRHTVFSINYFRQFHFNKEIEYPFSISNGPFQIEQELSNEIEGEFSSIGPAFAIDLTQNLALGFSVNIWNHDLTGSSKYTISEKQKEEVRLFGGPPTVNTLRIDEEVEIDNGYSFNIGALYRINRKWTLGAAVSPEYNLENSRYYRRFDSSVVPAEQVSNSQIEFTIPLKIGAGGAYRPDDHWTFSADIKWTDWSSYELETDTHGTVNPINGQAIENGRCEDTITIRTGLEHLFIKPDTLYLSAAGFFMTSYQQLNQLTNTTASLLALVFPTRTSHLTLVTNFATPPKFTVHSQKQKTGQKIESDTGCLFQ